MLSLKHETVGRLRVRDDALISNPPRADAWARTALSVAGVKAATVNPVTGSLVILYDGREAVRDAILDRLDVREQQPMAVSHARQSSALDVSRLMDVIAQSLVDRALQALVAAII